MPYPALLFCADEKTAHIVEKILSELEFAVASCSEPFDAVKRITTEHFDAIVVDCKNEPNAALLFKSARNSASNHSSLAVALVEGQAGIAKAFRIGANLVLSKPINVEQSKSTLRVARGLLRKAEAAKPATALIPEPLVPSVETDQEAIPAEFIPASETRDQPEASPSFMRPPSMMMLPEAPAAAAGLQVEVEEEPTPALGVAEAALLESLRDALPQSAVVSTGLSKAPSSQLASNPLLAPATTPLAAEPALKSASASAQTSSQPSPSQVSPGDLPETKEGTPRTNSPSATNNTAGNSAAAGTAPAKEIPGAVVNLFEPKPAAASSPVTAPSAPKKARDSKTPAKTSTLAARPAKSKSDVEDPNQEAPIDEGSKKNLLIAAGLVLGLAAAGYFAWPTLQPAIMNLGIVRKYLAPQPAPAPVPTPAPVSTSAPAPDSASTSSPTATSASDSSEASPATNLQEQPAAVAPSETQPQTAPAETSQTPAQQPQSSASAQPAVAPPTPKPSAQTTHLPQASPQVPESHAPTAPRATAPVAAKGDIKKDAPKRPIPPPAPLEVSTNSTDKTMAAALASAAPAIVAKPAPQVIRVSQDVSIGLLIKRVQPVYPTLATQMRVEGAVELDATIGKDGSTSDIKVLKGDPMLAKAAVDAVRQWKYKPYLLDGQPVQLQTQITVNFKLPL